MPEMTTILDTAILVLAIPTAVALLVMIIGAACTGYDAWHYLRNQLIALDQSVNTLCGGAPDETISAVAYRKGGSRYDPIRWRIIYHTVNTVFFWQADHCLSAYESEVARRHLHPSYVTPETLG